MLLTEKGWCVGRGQGRYNLLGRCLQCCFCRFSCRFKITRALLVEKGLGGGIGQCGLLDVVAVFVVAVFDF